MIEENQQNADKTAEKQQKKVPGRPFKKGQSGNPNGRPKGSRNFSTVFDLAIENLKKKTDLKIEDPEVEMMSVAMKEALKGDSKYFIYLMNKKYGMPKQSIGLGADEEITSLNITIKNEDGTELTRKQKHNEGIHKESDRMESKEKQNNN